MKLKNGGCRAFKKTVLWLMAVVMAVSVYAVRTKNTVPATAAAAQGKSLSLLEINNSFGVMVIRTTNYMTLIYIDRIYFEYNASSSLRLKELDCIVNITNEAAEWAKVPGYVKTEQAARPDDPSGVLQTLQYIEVQQYWEWRSFTNEERWNLEVYDGYNRLQFDFTRGRDGTVYHIDGVYALPEKDYYQVSDWRDVKENKELRASVNEYAANAAKAALAAAAQPGSPLKVAPVKYDGRWVPVGADGVLSHGQVLSHGVPAARQHPDGAAVLTHGSVLPYSGEQQVADTGVFLTIVLISICVVAVAWIVADTVKMVSNKNAGPVEVTPEIKEEYDAVKPELTEPERIELDKHKEFSPDRDAPSGQKVVKLMVIDEDGRQQQVYDENGEAVYINRKTNVIGNSTYALINRETFLLIVFDAATMGLKDTAGNKITVNVDNRIINMDGVEPYSFKTKNDLLKKLNAMGKYTSAIKPAKLMFRIDDNDALSKASNMKDNNPSVGFFGTIGNAFKNLFGGGGGSSGLSTFLDVLVILGVGLVTATVTVWVIGLVKKKKAG